MLQTDFAKVLETPFHFLQETVEQQGVEAYLIGGFVRDLILQRNQKKDIDIVAVGSGIALAKAVQKKLKGAKPVQIFKNFGTAMIDWEGVSLEFVGARKESYSPESRNPEVVPGSLEDDQNRRDFTINALALSLNKDIGAFLDPFNGLKDLENKLRTPGSYCAFSDDPLRMLRAIRLLLNLILRLNQNT